MITKSTGPPELTRRRIALIAHDHKTEDLRERARFNRSLLTAHHRFAAGTTGRLLSESQAGAGRAAIRGSLRGLSGPYRACQPCSDGLPRMIRT